MFKVKHLKKVLTGQYEVTVLLNKEDAENLMEYALNDLVEKGAISISEETERGFYRLLNTPSQGNS